MEDEELGTTNTSNLTCPMNLEEVKKHDIDNPEKVLVKGQSVGEENTTITMEKDNAEKLKSQQAIGEEPNRDAGESPEEAVCLENSNISNSNIGSTLKSEKLGENKESTKMEDTPCSGSENKNKHLSKIDFSVFEEGLYRRYKSFFHDKQANEIDLSQDKITVSKKINEHFSGFEINPVDVIRTFLVLRKNSEHSHGHFVMSPAQSPEPNIHPSSEGNTRGRRCANKDIGSVGNDANNTEANANGANSYKGEYKSENSSIADNHAEIGVSTRNSRKGRVSNRGRR
ncbi:uncharacterized protein cubi_01003 [Cryptosporidium ubiquitum]|uniref:Histone deacetylase complex subunit SAP30 Sin3 binding domain-containing protein n=1 Tax=Cryptosporidium ubiquitum TaxID=857276 RepID=A0A1J4M9G7_9CRYT|nr:uncharacterized protein cubi_01003 [Cryptosporidium ubiquitum]OII70858.1 hypothetical protein cubi_01003 [Cryptosporidium ubiquitum]